MSGVLGGSHGQWSAGLAASKLPALQQRMEAVNAELRNAMRAARNYVDPDNPKATGGVVDERRRQLRELAQQRAVKQRDALEQERQQLIGQVRGWAEQMRPKVTDDPVQLQKMSLAWDRAQSLLNAGHTMSSVLEGATDPAMLLAIREWGADWVRSHTPPAKNLAGQTLEVDTSGLARSADMRLSELLGGEVKTGVGFLHDAEAFEASWSALDHTFQSAMHDVRQDPSNTLADAYATTQAAVDVRAGYREPVTVVPGSPKTHEGEAA